MNFLNTRHNKAFSTCIVDLIPWRIGYHGWKEFCYVWLMLDWSECLGTSGIRTGPNGELWEQCRFCPSKTWSNADLAPQNYRAFIFCPAKSQSLHTLPRKIMEQCRLCTAKSQRHSFRGPIFFSKLDLKKILLN